MFDGSNLTVPSGVFRLQTVLTSTSPASGDFNIYTDGEEIDYGTGGTVCGSGSGTYDLFVTVTQLQ